MPVMGVARFERFFRSAASLNVDTDDLNRYSDFVNQKVYDLLIMAQATAQANGRGMIETFDLPLPKGCKRASTSSGSSTSRSSCSPYSTGLPTCHNSICSTATSCGIGSPRSSVG
jgi:hypothetical protein